MVDTPLAPRATKRPHSTTYHGVTHHDDYAWLRADNWQDVFRDPAVLDQTIRQHLEAENAYQNAFMADTHQDQTRLFEEMKGRLKQDDSSVPVPDGPYCYGVAFTTGAEQPNFVRSLRQGGEQHIYLNGDKEAGNKDYFQLGAVSHAPNHKKFLWSFDDKGSEFYNLYVRDFDNSDKNSDILHDTAGHGVWDAKSEGFFYTKLDAKHRPSEVYYHQLGTDQNQDQMVYREDNAGFFVTISGSRLNDYVYIDVHDHETSEVWLLKADAPLSAPVCVKKRETGVEYTLTEGQDVFYILTNANGAKDFKIMTTPVTAPSEDNWREVVPHEKGRLILFHDAYRNYVVWMEQANGLPRIVIKNRNDGQTHAVAFDEEAYSLSFSGAAEYDTDVVRFSYSSLTTPQQLFDYNMATRARKLLKTQDVPSGHTASNYVTRRVMATANDGELVPISLYYHKDTKLDGSAPCLLYGYGAYGMSMPASFSTTTLSLVNRGFVYAIAHIRGGQEKGFSWYEQGKHCHKRNTFTDFIAAARHLVTDKFTAHDRLIALGGSAGGMLMGAVANIAPQDFRAIVAIVPFVDVLNTMLDKTLPLTPPEWPEWGNPLLSQQDYQRIANYSPYDNVTKQDYPHILAIAGLTDPRVTYWEAAKWIAKLRELKTDENPALLRINMDSGHGGAAGRFSKLEETAYIYAYILKVLDKLPV